MGDYIIPARFYRDELANLKRDDYWEWVKQVQAHKRQWQEANKPKEVINYKIHDKES